MTGLRQGLDNFVGNCFVGNSGSIVEGCLISHSIWAWWQGIRVELYRTPCKSKENGVYLLALVQTSCQVLECQDEVAVTGLSLPKSMLLVRQDAMSLEVLHYLAVQDVFHDLTAWRRQGDGPVFGWTATITFLEEWSNICLPSVLWDFALLQWGLKDECDCWGNFLCVVFQKPGWNTVWASSL